MSTTAPVTTTGNNAVVANTPIRALRDLLTSDSAKKAIAAALPKGMSADRLTRVALTAANKNPKLLECSKESVFQALMECAGLGLEPDSLGRCYLIPYTNSIKQGNDWVKITQCQFQIGYKGLVELAFRSGQVATIQAQVVYENDQFDFWYGLDEALKHRPAMGDRGQAIGAYAYCKLKDGAFKMDFMSVADVNRIRDRSQGWQMAQQNAAKYNKPINSPWASDWDEMAKKTVFKRLSKMLPLSPEMADAIATDEDKERGEMAVDMPVTAPVPTDSTAANKPPPTEPINTTAERVDQPTQPKRSPFAASGTNEEKMV